MLKGIPITTMSKLLLIKNDKLSISANSIPPKNIKTDDIATK